MAKIEDSEFQVVLPYKRLCELLEASKKVEKLEREMKRLSEQQVALRSLYTELAIAFGDLKRHLND